MRRETTVQIFQAKISYDKTWIWRRKGNLKRETEYLLIAAQNNAIRINYVKAKIDQTQQKCNKLMQKENKTRPTECGR